MARLSAQFGVWLGLLSVAVVAAWLSYSWSERQGYERLDDTAARQLDLYVSVIENELGKQAYLPSLLEADRDIEILLRSPENTGMRDLVSRGLTRFSVTSGISAALVVDTQGTVVGSSDSYRADTTLGQDFSGQPYVLDALAGEESRYFASHPITGAPEYFFSRPVVRDDRILGVVAVRVSLAPMESTWVDLAFRAESEKPLVIDAQGVVIISSVPAWKFKSITPLVASRGGAAGARPGRYPVGNVEPLGMQLGQRLEPGTQLAELAGSPNEAPTLAVIHQRLIPRFGWRLLIFSNAADVWRTARLTAWGTGALTALAGLLLLYWRQRRRVVAQKLATRQALQRAHDQLERTVQQRTLELQNSNSELQHEIAERRHAETVLRHAQEELVQAEKLALLGQMSASISHEVGQPLTAMRALSENARLLLARGQSGQVADNLAAITGLVERMGRITAQLKSFARKTSMPFGQVRLAGALRSALQVLEVRLRAERIELRVDVPDDLSAQCDGNRLEQVLVNLMANAIDAMHGGDHKEISVRAWAQDGRAVMRIGDTGPGIPEDLRGHLFEPFFTTKPAGEGLGLGLVISSNIVKEFGGELRAVPVERGAAFEFDLRLSDA